MSDKKLGQVLERPVYTQTSSKMGHVRSKTRSLGQILEKPCVRSRGHIFSLLIIETSSKTGHVQSKTRSLGQILEKPCVRSRGHIFSLIIMKLSQNVCLDEILDEFENRSCGMKN